MKNKMRNWLLGYAHIVMLISLAFSLSQPLSFSADSNRNTSDHQKPNIIIILTDDLGYGDVSCNGATAIQTPNIDSLAKTGIRFTSGYSSASTCTPTRYSLLTGTYAFRVPGTGIAPPNSPALIKPGTPTIASILKSANYRTAVIGKWHLGLGGESGPEWNSKITAGPNEIGFDYSFILPTTNDRVPQVYVQDGKVVNLDPSDPLWIGNKKPSEDHPTGLTHRHLLKMDWSHGHNQSIHNGVGRIGFYTGGQQARFRDEDLADTWVRECRKWIEADRDEPFFLFFNPHNIHVPRVVHERFQGKSNLGPRGDAVLELDWTVGEILHSLETANKRHNTLIVFCSDNGPVLDDGYVDDAIEKLGSHKPAGPFRGGKYNVFEAGTRTPFLVSWPAKIPQGTSSDEVVCTIDLSASLASLVGVPVPEKHFEDSQDIMTAFMGVSGAKGRSSLVLQDNGTSGNFGYRAGKWKLIRHKTPNSRNVELRLVNTPVPPIMLFDLEKDPYESENLSEAHPEVVKELLRSLEDTLRTSSSRTTLQ